MDNRKPVMRQQSGSASQPLTKVVGFRVEGVPPSPSPHPAVLGGHGDGGPHTHVGSPSPVIIPPSFQATDSPIRRNAEDEQGRPLIHQGSGLQRSGGSTIAEQMAALRVEEMGEGPSMSAATSPGMLGRDTLGVAAVAAAALPARSASDPAQIAQLRAAAAHNSSAVSSAAGSPYRTTAPKAANTTPPTTPGRGYRTSQPTSPQPAVVQQPAASPVQPKQQQQQQQPPKGPPPAGGEKPKLTRAQRREIQEQQRAAKAAAKAGLDGGAGNPKAAGSQRGGTGGNGPPSSAASVAPPTQGSVELQRPGSARPSRPTTLGDGPAPVSTQQQQAMGAGAAASASRSLALFSHLPPHRSISLGEALAKCRGEVHPTVMRLGLEYASGAVRGADARCIAMLQAFRTVVEDYRTPEGKTLQRDLVAHLSAQVRFLVECRPLGTAMGNAIKYVKRFVTHIGGSVSEVEAKEEVLDMVDSYIKDKIIGCTKVLVDKALPKLADGDVVLTYGLSSVVLQLLLRAKAEGRRFRVVVVDSRPLLEGKEMMRRLLAAGISCTYAYITAVGYVVKEATKVFLGAAAVLSNGTVISRVGSAMVAMSASAAHVPVMICAESHKFHERVQLDSITNNELGDPDDIAHVVGHPEADGLQGWQEVPKLGVLNLLYDAMPCEYISMICTEFGSLPPSSVPVILRESREDWLPSAGP